MLEAMALLEPIAIVVGAVVIGSGLSRICQELRQIRVIVGEELADMTETERAESQREIAAAYGGPGMSPSHHNGEMGRARYRSN